MAFPVSSNGNYDLNGDSFDSDNPDRITISGEYRFSVSMGGTGTVSLRREQADGDHAIITDSDGNALALDADAEETIVVLRAGDKYSFNVADASGLTIDGWDLDLVRTY